MSAFFVRLGQQGQIGRFRPLEPFALRRGQRVICRTARGLEAGEVLGPAADSGNAADGDLIRPMSLEDQLLAARLEQRRHEAFEACQRLLAARDLSAVLVDVETTFDGQSLTFQFLGDVPDEVNVLTEQLAQAFESAAQLQSFAATLAAGCGPQCGTPEAAGCGSGGCATCSLVAACSR